MKLLIKSLILFLMYVILALCARTKAAEANAIEVPDNAVAVECF